MAHDDLEHGRLIGEGGAATLCPAEFVLFRIGHKTAAPPL